MARIPVSEHVPTRTTDEERSTCEVLGEDKNTIAKATYFADDAIAHAAVSLNRQANQVQTWTAIAREAANVSSMTPSPHRLIDM
ncbi:hypothetical protein E4U53_003822, partial [Claviceps sorghi]